MNSKTRYGVVPQIIHWLTALFVSIGWLLGQFGDYLPKGTVRGYGLLTHMTLGQCVVALLIIRLLWRIANPPPPLEPTRLGWLLEGAARMTHFALYALLLLVPIVGMVVQMKRGHALPIFGYWHFDSPWPADRTIARSVLRLHKYLANSLLILAGLHAAAALIHHWAIRDRTLVRMLPGAA